MKNSKLVLLLEALSVKEWRKLEDFVESPYFNKDQRLIHLLKHLGGDIRDTDSATLERERVFARVFPDEVYNKAYFNHLLNYLLQLVERFLAHQALKADKIQQAQSLLQVYLNRRLDKHYALKKKQLWSTLAAYPYREDHYYYQRFAFARIENERFLVERQRVAHTAIEESSAALDTFYIIQKLKFLAEILDRQKKFPQSYNVQGGFELLEVLTRSKDISDEPYILVYRQLIIMLLHEEEEAHYEAFKQLLDQHASQIKLVDLKTLFLFAINYCVRKMGAGHNFQQNLLTLYTSGLANGTLLEQNRLSPWTYKNVIQLGLAQWEVERVAQFIEEYAPKLPPHLHKDAYHYNLAALHYARKDYEQAMDYLNRVEYSDLSYKLWSKELLVKLYYELKEQEPLHSLLLSFEQLVKRNKQIPRPQQAAYHSFIRFVGKLMRPNRDSEKLRTEIQSAPYLRERKWLLSKL